MTGQQELKVTLGRPAGTVEAVAFSPLPDESDAVVPLVSSNFHQAIRPNA